MKCRMSETFREKVLPILQSYIKDGRKVGFNWQWIDYKDGGMIPMEIAVFEVPFAYTLHLRDIVDENFADCKIFISHPSKFEENDYMPIEAMQELYV